LIEHSYYNTQKVTLFLITVFFEVELSGM
jgi:hypothetical protein